MHQNLLIPAEYPVKKDFTSFWTDPELYFSLIPRDIVQFCVAPYLSWLATEELTGQRSCQPIEVGMCYLNVLDEFDQPIVLRDGCFLGRTNEKNTYSTDLCYIDPRVENAQITWLIEYVQGYTYSYDRTSDSLYLEKKELDQYQVIPLVSQVCAHGSFAEVLAQAPILPGSPPAVPDSIVQLNEDIDSKFFHPIDRAGSITVNYRGQPVTLSLKEYDPSSWRLIDATFYGPSSWRLIDATFYGGYLILILYSRVASESLMFFYRTVL